MRKIILTLLVVSSLSLASNNTKLFVGMGLFGEVISDSLYSGKALGFDLNVPFTETDNTIVGFGFSTRLIYPSDVYIELPYGDDLRISNKLIYPIGLGLSISTKDRENYASVLFQTTLYPITKAYATLETELEEGEEDLWSYDTIGNSAISMKIIFFGEHVFYSIESISMFDEGTYFVGNIGFYL